MGTIERFRLIAFLLILLGVFGCNNKKDISGTNNSSPAQIAENLLQANKASIVLENEQIDKFIVRSGWDMAETPTGLRYQILEAGQGAKTATGRIVQFEYEVGLISGEEIYSSKLTGPKEFQIGNGGVESGLEEGMLLLKVGEKARFIIPSYLAHGLSGDQDRIPPKATLIYTVKLIALK